MQNLFWVGLVVTSIATGHIYSTAMGFMVLGFGLMAMGMLNFLNGR